MKEVHSILNQRFGTWLVINTAPRRNNTIYYLCKCDCGIEKEVSKKSLKAGTNKNCGCLRTKDLTNKQIGHWQVLNKVNNPGATKYNCKCICGIQKEVSASSLLNNKSLSCGCVNKTESLLNQVFHKLTALSYQQGKYNCKCECGNYINVEPFNLINNKVRSCGCIKKPNLINQKFNMLIVTSLNEERSCTGNQYWNCLCDCGNTTTLCTSSLTRNITKSCGCINTGSTTHGLSHTKENKIYRGMKYRCLNPNSPAYKDYGERGIKICDRWLKSFENFLEDMGNIPSKNHSIERVNVNGNYEPNNCKWIERRLQGRNTRTNILSYEIIEDMNKIKDVGLSDQQIYAALKVKYPNIHFKVIKRALSGETWA